MTHILVVDDEEDARQMARLVLEDVGHLVTTAKSGEEALRFIAGEKPDAIILDILMPGLDGVSVCRRIRANPFVDAVPIIFLTAVGTIDVIEEALDAGGDDYLVKPFDVIELVARVQALLRRTEEATSEAELDHITAGNLRLHSQRLEVRAGDRRIKLTSLEYSVLRYLMMRAGQPVSVAQLLENVWGYPGGTGDPNLVRASVVRLRAKIEPTPGKVRYVLNVHGRGYMVEG